MNEQQAMEHIGARMRDLRLEREVRQVDLAEQIGVTMQVISKIECGLTTMTAARLYMVAKALKVAPAAFFEGLK